MKPVYLDYNATTPLDPRVFEAMRPYYLTEVGNAGSRTHIYGQRAKDAVERARGQVARLLGARSPRRSSSRAARPRVTTSLCSA